MSIIQPPADATAGDWRTVHPARIRLDVFPASAPDLVFPDPDLVFPDPDHAYRNLRVVVTDDHWFAFVDTDRGPTAAAFGELYDLTPDPANRRAFTVTPADPATPPFTVTRSSGCGCGSRLRGFAPFPGVPLAGAPVHGHF